MERPPVPLLAVVLAGSKLNVTGREGEQRRMG